MEKAVVTSLNSRNNNEVESVTLSEWVKSHYSEEEMRSIFLNMDRALKYIHEHGYCIDVFYPTEINVLNNDDRYVQFKKLVELSKDYDLAKEMMREDIFRSSLIQVGIYTNSLNYMNPDFLKENFDSFAQFIPQDDVPYYRGVIQRNASVYFCEYALEKRKRDLEDLERQLGEEGSAVVTPINEPSEAEITNKKVNDLIYRQINGISEAAFLNMALIPIVLLILICIIMCIVMISNFIG
ncbi:MAG: hypothetical protein IK137_03960 [Bacilli bacterium]|nr:hypothetical protein [Bacilli bacterium]